MKRLIARFLLWIVGWKHAGDIPPHDKAVLVAAPHTSNWDFVLLLLFGWAHRQTYRWMGKRSLFWPPLGWVLKAWGGIPIDRSRKNSVVAQMTRAFGESEQLVVAIPPEATRKRAPHWRSGFYRIAAAAGVPIVLGCLDYGRKIASLGPTVWPSGDIAADMDIARAFYADKRGRYPEQFGPVRLKDEGSAR